MKTLDWFLDVAKNYNEPVLLNLKTKTISLGESFRYDFKDHSLEEGLEKAKMFLSRMIETNQVKE